MELLKLNQMQANPLSLISLLGWQSAILQMQWIFQSTIDILLPMLTLFLSLITPYSIFLVGITASTLDHPSVNSRKQLDISQLQSMPTIQRFKCLPFTFEFTLGSDSMSGAICPLSSRRHFLCTSSNTWLGHSFLFTIQGQQYEYLINLNLVSSTKVSSCLRVPSSRLIMACISSQICLELTNISFYSYLSQKQQNLSLHFYALCLSSQACLLYHIYWNQLICCFVIVGRSSKPIFYIFQALSSCKLLEHILLIIRFYLGVVGFFRFAIRLEEFLFLQAATTVLKLLLESVWWPDTLLILVGLEIYENYFRISVITALLYSLMQIFAPVPIALNPSWKPIPEFYPFYWKPNPKFYPQLSYFLQFYCDVAQEWGEENKNGFGISSLRKWLALLTLLQLICIFLPFPPTQKPMNGCQKATPPSIISETLSISISRTFSIGD